jgi:hypothetical protein
MQDEITVGFDQRQLSSILRSFKAMDDEAVDQARKIGGDLAEFAASKIRDYSLGSRYVGSRRVANAVTIKRTSKIGEFSYGLKSQRFFSGGASTLDTVYGLEFGSNRYSQFPNRSPQLGRGSAGYFIFPTLKRIQPEILKKWLVAFDKIQERFV